MIGNAPQTLTKTMRVGVKVLAEPFKTRHTDRLLISEVTMAIKVIGDSYKFASHLDEQDRFLRSPRGGL